MREPVRRTPEQPRLPVCLGLPGALPVLNRHAVTLALRAALATGCAVHPVSVFERKNYFYPDLPKGYQISQYERPLATEGAVAIAAGDGGERAVRLAASTWRRRRQAPHEGFPCRREERGRPQPSRVPLIEIVSQPDLRSPDEAHAYLTALKAILLYARSPTATWRRVAPVRRERLGEAPRGRGFGTRTEIKNLNSFRNVARALDTRSRGRWRSWSPAGGRPGDALWNPDRNETVPCGPRRGPRLPLLPRTRPAPLQVRGPGSRRRGARCRSCRRRGVAASRASTPCRATTRAC